MNFRVLGLLDSGQLDFCLGALLLDRGCFDLRVDLRQLRAIRNGRLRERLGRHVGSADVLRILLELRGAHPDSGGILLIELAHVAQLLQAAHLVAFQLLGGIGLDGRKELECLLLLGQLGGLLLRPLGGLRLLFRDLGLVGSNVLEDVQADAAGQVDEIVLNAVLEERPVADAFLRGLV